VRVNKKNIYNYTTFPMRLDFFADGGGGGEKTEKATPKKKEQARKEGQVAKSQEIGTAISSIVVFFSMGLFAPFMFAESTNVFLTVFDLMLNLENISDMHFALDFVVYMFTQTLIISMPIFAIAFFLGFVVNFVQVGWHPTAKPLMPKFSKLNPISGFKKIFSMNSILELFKSLFKFGIITLVIYNELIMEFNNMFMFVNMPLITSLQYAGQLVIRLGIVVGVWFIFIAAVDFAYQKYKHGKDLRMSKQDIKDEFKQSDGNPQIKGKIKQKMREASMRRMMQDIPHADVVITNPTHFAVVIKYDRASTGAPKVVAKGADHLAKRIKDVAKENNISIIENKQLARALYATVDVGKEIPPELYKAVAETLAFVYKLKNKV